MFLSKKVRRKVKYTLLYFFVSRLIATANFIPRRAWLSFCGFLGNIAGHLAVGYRKLALKHLTIAFGDEKSQQEIKRLSYQTFVMLGKNVGDVLRAVNVDSLEKLEKFVKMKGMEHYEEADRKGKGVVFIACHLGAFELRSPAWRSAN